MHRLPIYQVYHQVLCRRFFRGDGESKIRYASGFGAFFEEPLEVREHVYNRYERNGSYTVDDYRTLPDEQRGELIDGYFYDMASSTFGHQSIGGEIHRQIANFIVENGGNCRPFIAPVDVQLDCDEKTMVQPDVGIVCDSSKIQRFGVYGAPDFLVEVISPSTKKKDYTLKLSKYIEAGVREYWIVDYMQEKVLVYFFESDVYPVIMDLTSQFR